VADTTAKGFPYPEGPDAVDVAGDIQLLAEAVDDMPGVQSYTGTEISNLVSGEKWAGRIVWNSTTGKLQVSNGSAFSDVDTSLALASTNPAALGVAAVGNGTTAARDNHVHVMPSASDVGAIATTALTATNPAALDTAAAPGSSTDVARRDHVHAFPTASDVGAVANALVTAKGQIVGASASGTPAAIPAASGDGLMLVSDSAEASGNKFSSTISAVYVGPTSAITTRFATSDVVPAVQAAGSSAAAAGLLNARYVAAATGPTNFFAKSRNATTGSHTVVQDGDILGAVSWAGSDGAKFVEAARIESRVDGSPSTSDMPGRLMFYTTADGAQSPTERMRLDSAGLVTGSGTSLGAWTSWTPTISNGTWALGNGTATGVYCRIGKIVHFSLRVTLGSTSVTDATNILQVSLPVASVSGFSDQRFAGRLTDVSLTNVYGAIGYGESTTTIGVGYISTASGLIGAVLTSAPFAWADGDIIRLSGSYEAA
jgi:hypothetical protein